MRIFDSLLISLAISAASLLNLTSPCQSAEPEAAAIDRVVENAMKAWQVPGVVLVVVHKDRVLVLKGYGVKRLGDPTPMSPDTLVPLASCTKAFTATLAGMLVDDGVLRWDDLVQRHLPRFRLSDPNADALVSLRDLLAHRTGVKGHDLLWYHAPWSIDETIARVEHLPLEYPFRGGFDYSSIMYMAAGRVISAATDKPWERLVRDRITRPLGMKSVHFTTTTIPRDADRATGHIRRANGRIETLPEYAMVEPNPAGSMHVTARDLAAWLKFQLAGGVVNKRRLISEASLKETRTPQTIIRLEGLAKRMNPETRSLSYGLGWIVYDHRGKLVLAHGGVMDGFRTQITLLPEEGLGFALLNNLHETRMNQAIANSLIDFCCDLPPRDWNAHFQAVVKEEEAEKTAERKSRALHRQPGVKPSLPLAAYTGEYSHPAYGTATIKEAKGKLQVKWSSFQAPLEHWQRDEFRVSDGFLADRFIDFAVTPQQSVAGMRFLDQSFEKK